jgi:hypothetical protein
LYSADFVDTPAANADGVFSADQIDSEEIDMSTDKVASTPEPQVDFSALIAEQFAAFTAKFDAVATQFAEDNAKVLAECEQLKADLKALQSGNSDIELQARLAAAAPAPAAFAAPINEPEVKVPAISYHEAKNQAIGTATGLDRLKAVRAFTEKFPTEAAYVSANS